MNALNTRIPPPILFLVTATAMWLVARFTHHWMLEVNLRHGLITFLLLVAAMFGSSAIYQFRRSATTIDPVKVNRASTLVTHGPFYFSRNPMYLAMLALLFAWAVHLHAPWAFAGPILFELYLLRFQIWPGERAMMEKFGDNYLSHAKSVRRWI
jgi:protein-S-isoprenylcysteine O-methyltransferase Ste14